MEDDQGFKDVCIQIKKAKLFKDPAFFIKE